MKTIIVKNIALSAFMFIAFAASAFAKPTDVSKYLMKQFQKQYQHANNVTWKTTDHFTFASFDMNGDKISVFYNTDNNVIGISKDISVQDLPKVAQQTVTKGYKNYTIVSTIGFTDENGDESYYIQLENKGKQIILKSDLYGNVSEYQN